MADPLPPRRPQRHPNHRPPQRGRPGVGKNDDKRREAERSKLITAVIGLIAAACLLGAGFLVFADDSPPPAQESATEEKGAESSDSKDSATGSGGDDDELETGNGRDDQSRLADLRGLTVGLDPGHNGQNLARASRIARNVSVGNSIAPCDQPGVEVELPGGSDSLSESALAMNVAKLVRQKLQDAGAEVRMTRLNDDSLGPCVDKRIAVLEQSDVAISLHTVTAQAKVRGFQVLVADPQSGALSADKTRLDRRLALSVARIWRDETGLRAAKAAGADGILESPNVLLGNLSVPSVQLEFGNLANLQDRAILTDPADTERLADAIVSAIAEYARGTRDEPRVGADTQPKDSE